MTLETIRTGKRSTILARARLHGASNVRVFVLGENGHGSDVDFLVDLGAGRDRYDLGALQAGLRELLSTSVDLVEATCLHPYIREQVLAESVPL